MRFRDLYKAVENEITQPSVRFEFLRERINQSHFGVGEINVYPVVHPKPIYQAHYILREMDRSSAYEEEYQVARIHYCTGLDNHIFLKRFALTKELMHVFDADSELTDSRDKFIELVREIQNQPISDASGMYRSELGTKWMALIILCPKPVRAQLLEQFNSGVSVMELSAQVSLPEYLIPHILDPYYEEAFELVMRK